MQHPKTFVEKMEIERCARICNEFKDRPPGSEVSTESIVHRVLIAYGLDPLDTNNQAQLHYACSVRLANEYLEVLWSL